MNPLLMEDTLDDLYNKLTMEDLKICRLVCQLWNKRIEAHLKKNWKDLKEISLVSEKSVKSFSNTMAKSKDKLLFRRFTTNSSLINMVMVQQFPTKFHPKYLQLALDCHNDAIHIENLIAFLKLCAPFVKQLVITGFAYFSEFRPLNNPDQWMDFNFPKLETIDSNFACGTSPLDILKIASGGHLDLDTFNDGQVILLIQEIYEKSPNLKSIENQILPKFPTFNPKSMSSGILEKLSKLTIRYLMADARFGQNDPSELIEMQNHGLRLKHLNIGYNYNSIYSDPQTIQKDMIVIEKFLQGQSGTLETIKLTIQDYQMKMPVFPKVKKFSFGVCKYNSPNSQINLMEQFPQLEAITLKVECTIFGNWHKIFCGSALKVKSIQIINKYHDPNPKANYLKLESFFPNIENLEIGIRYKNSTSYEPCWTGWTGSIKSIKISIFDRVENKHFPNLSFVPEQIKLNLKILENFKGLQRIEFTKVASIDFGPPHWIMDLKPLSSLENVKYVKLNKFMVSKTKLAELRKKYILDYNPGKCLLYVY